jgi:hypothetical protein
MKKLLYTLIAVFVSKAMVGQTVQASIKPLSGSDSNIVVISLNPSSTVTTRVSGISLTLGIPVSQAGTVQPVLQIINTANTSISWPDAQFVGIQQINGADHYVYDFQGTGSVTSPSDDRTYTTGVDNEIVRVRLNGDPIKTANIKLLSFPDFGTSGNSLFGLSFNGTDVANPTDPFYSIPSVSLASNSSASVSIVQTTGLVPLPVKFLNFTATKNKDAALLTWAVENEDVNTVSYEIQKSVNGVDFTALKAIPALNNGRSSNVYSFTQDNLSAIRSSGVIYFRVKQTDRDGKFVYTDIRSVRLGGKDLSVAVYPNPVKNTANVTFDLDANADVAISLVDASGKQLFTNQLQGIKGANITSINMSKMAPGSYTLKVQTVTETKVIPVVKASN